MLLIKLCIICLKVNKEYQQKKKKISNLYRRILQTHKKNKEKNVVEQKKNIRIIKKNLKVYYI